MMERPAAILRRELPEGIDRLQGKDYVNHLGLVYLAGKGPPWSCETEVLDVEKGEDGLPIYVLTRTTITVHGDPVRTYAAIGDATAKNTGIAKTALPRMSETRSCNRALRMYLGAPDTTSEEMPRATRAPFDEVARLRTVSKARISTGAWTAEQLRQALQVTGANSADDLNPAECVELRTTITTLTGSEWASRNTTA